MNMQPTTYRLAGVYYRYRYMLYNYIIININTNQSINQRSSQSHTRAEEKPRPSTTTGGANPAKYIKTVTMTTTPYVRRRSRYCR